MKISLLSPYHGGSHRAWADGFARHSRHQISLLTLPGRFWKWRMHGGAVTLARRFLEKRFQPDLILATDMLDLTTFLALTRRRTGDLPAVLYMHENQLTYPLPDDIRTGPMRRQLGERDRHYAFVNYASMLAADRVIFNSHFHRDTFFAALPGFLKHFPEYKELGSVADLQVRTTMLPVGIDFKRLEDDTRRGQDDKMDFTRAPLILWNQRWEYDKNPSAFLEALYVLAEEGAAFRVALCGQHFGRQPAEFAVARQRLAGRIVYAGHADQSLYSKLLWEAAVTVSTALHENFGISVLEAIFCQTFPILPDRLSYPELLPASFHQHCLYSGQHELVERLRRALTEADHTHETAVALSGAVARYDWSQVAPSYDYLLEQLARQ